MSKDFYRNLPAFEDFSEACNHQHYSAAPDDFYLVVTDVGGSTKAIQNGRYKDVNMVGAACITAAINACPDIQLSYVFGGDGATMLIPPDYVENIKRQMLAVKKLATSCYDLDLRVGIVPISELVKRGASLSVAKYKTSSGAYVSMYRGGGASLADDLIKNHGYSITDDKGVTEDADLSGLSCRWKPLNSRKSHILTLLVSAKDEKNSDETYKRINQKIVQILKGDMSPVHADNMAYHLPGKKVMRDSKIAWKHGNKAKNIFEHLFMISLFNILYFFNIKIGEFDTAQYCDDMIANSDYRKFDDMLRMVVDCSQEQGDAIEFLFKSRER